MKKYIAPQVEDLKLDSLMVNDVIGVATTSGAVQSMDGGVGV